MRLASADTRQRHDQKGFVDRLAKNGTPIAKAVLIIVTDGMENASREHTAAGIRSLLDARRERGWMVEFLAKGLDVAERGVALGIHRSAISTFMGGEDLVVSLHQTAGRVALPGPSCT